MHNETERISKYINFISPFVCDITKTIVESCGWQVTENNIGVNIVFLIKADDRQAEFYLHNLLFEVATIDRDANPLFFDEKLEDFDYFLEKTLNIIQSKLKILCHIFCETDIDTALNKITKEAKSYQRVRIIKLDNDKILKNFTNR